MSDEESYHSTHVKSNGKVVNVRVHKELLLSPCYCCGSPGHLFLGERNDDGIRMLKYNCPVSERKDEFIIQGGKLTVNMKAPFIKPSEFAQMYLDRPREEVVKRWFNFTHYGQGRHLPEDDRIWLEELVRRAGILLRTREPTERIYEITHSSALEDMEWTWLQGKRATDPSILRRGGKETISPCGWDCCPEHLNNIILENGAVISGCSFLGKKFSERSRPYVCAKHYRFSERIANKAIQQYMTWHAGKILSEREKFLLHYHVMELCRKVS